MLGLIKTIFICLVPDPSGLICPLIVLSQAKDLCNSWTIPAELHAVLFTQINNANSWWVLVHRLVQSRPLLAHRCESWIFEVKLSFQIVGRQSYYAIRQIWKKPCWRLKRNSSYLGCHLALYQISWYTVRYILHQASLAGGVTRLPAILILQIKAFVGCN